MMGKGKEICDIPELFIKTSIHRQLQAIQERVHFIGWCGTDKNTEKAVGSFGVTSP